MRVESSNIISYRYYEKPTTTNTMVQKRTALNENLKKQILSNDLVRRLANTDDRQPDAGKQSVLEQFAKKALTSGYSNKKDCTKWSERMGEEEVRKS